MKKHLLTLLLGAVMLVMTACSNKAVEDASTTLQENESTPSESAEEITASAESSEEENADNYTVTIEQQDISYLTPSGDAELANISLRKITLGNTESPAVQTINEGLSAAYENALSIINGTDSSQESDFLYHLPNEAYEQYVISDREIFTAYYYYQEYSVQRVDNNVFSFVDDSYLYNGGAHGLHMQFGVNYNMQTGERLTLADLSDDENAFTSYCAEQLLELAAAKEAEEPVFFDGYEENISDIISDSTFYFSEEGLCFISQEYVLQPYASGAIILCIPYEKLEGYLKEEYLSQGASWEVATSVKDPISYTFQRDFTDDVAVPMLDSFLTWTGLQYFYSENAQIDTLTTEAALGMAGFAILNNYAYEEDWYVDSEGSYAMPASVVDAYTQNYFGKTYDISSYDDSEQASMVSATSDGELLVKVGDWGLRVPQYKIIDATLNEDGSYTVKVDYTAYDYELSEEFEVLAVATYTFTPDDNSIFGYVITDLQLTQTASLS